MDQICSWLKLPSEVRKTKPSPRDPGFQATTSLQFLSFQPSRAVRQDDPDISRFSATFRGPISMCETAWPHWSDCLKPSATSNDQHLFPAFVRCISLTALFGLHLCSPSGFALDMSSSGPGCRRLSPTLRVTYPTKNEASHMFFSVSPREKIF